MEDIPSNPSALDNSIRMEWGIINWKIEDLESTDRKTRKLLNMHEGLYHSFNKDRLYFQDFGWTRLNIY